MSPTRDPALSDWFGKKSWIPCRLQSLSTKEFIKAVNLILRGHHRVITYDRDSSMAETVVTKLD